MFNVHVQCQTNLYTINYELFINISLNACDHDHRQIEAGAGGTQVDVAQWMPIHAQE